MKLLENLLEWDRNTFLLLNGCHSNFFDGFMWLISSKTILIPSVICLFYVILKDKKKETLLITFGIILTIILSDQISSSIIKPIFERLRPSHEPLLEGLVHIVNGYKGGKFGFVSSHAANSFGFALFTALIFRYKPYTITIFILALLISYSRIYLGVHYPLDIIGGSLVGLLSASFSYFLYYYMKKSLTGLNYIPYSKTGLISSGFSYKNIRLIIFFLILTIFFLSVFSFELVKFIPK